jgi:hypothetical protein
MNPESGDEEHAVQPCDAMNCLNPEHPVMIILNIDLKLDMFESESVNCFTGL